jgi:hypothetical protein
VWLTRSEHERHRVRQQQARMRIDCELPRRSVRCLPCMPISWCTTDRVRSPAAF